MSDTYSIVPDPEAFAAGNVLTAGDANPDQAARALELSRATGIPSTVAYDNLEDVEGQQKAAMGAAIVRSNPFLTAYVNSHPLAAKVSNDDWAAMDEATHKAALLHSDSFLGAMAKGFQKGIGTGSVGDWTGIDYTNPEVVAKRPAAAAWAATITGVTDPFEAIARLAAGAWTAGGYGLSHLAGKTLGPGAKQMGEDITEAGLDPGLWASLGPLGEAPAVALEAMRTNAEMRGAITKLTPYIAEGKPPPVGIHPDIDAIHVEQAQADKEALGDALKAATASATRERAPDLFANLMGQITQGEIGVKADAIRTLYGDKVPAPDDGILGWVPKLQEQLLAAEASGGDVQVPLKDWLAKVEPDVAKALEDHVRFRPEGMTVEEAKTPVEYQQMPTDEGADAHTQTVDSMRQAASLEPKITPAAADAGAVVGEAIAKELEPFVGKAPGLTKAQTGRYLDLIEKRQKEDAAAAESRVMKEQRQRQTAEWNTQWEAMRRDVSAETYGSPSASLLDHLHEGRLKIATDALTDTQRAALPSKWVAAKGVEPSDLAGIFRTDDTGKLISDTANLETARAASGLDHKPFLERMIDAETDRRMEAAHGKLAQNILEEAKDQILSETQENLLHEQTLRLAEEAGAEYPLKPDQIKAEVKDNFAQLPASSISSDRFLAAAGRAGRAMEDAHLKGDVAEAFRQSQAQQLAFLYAKEAKAFEKESGQFDRLAKRYSKREVAGVLPEYTNAIHSIFAKVGLPIGRLPADLARELGAGEYKDLADFVKKKEADFAVSQITLPVADFLLGPNKMPIDEMSVYEKRGLMQSVKALDHFGKGEAKLIKGAETFERKEWVGDAVKQLADRFEPREMSIKEGRFDLARKFGKQVVAALHSLETVFYRFDGRDPKGMFTEMLTYPAAEAMNYQNKLERDFGRSYRELGGIEKPNRAVDHDFIDPMTGKKFVGMTRGNLEAIVANIGNKYNLDRIAFSLGVDYKDPAAMQKFMQWVEQNTKPEDIDRAQARGKLFGELKKMSDTVYRNIYGVAPEDITLQPFAMHGKEYSGWYHPIIQDEERGLRDHARVPGDAVTKPTNFWPSTPNGYTQRRTGAFDRLSLNNRMVPIKMMQVVHDIAAREFVWNASKIINDDSFRAGVTKYYGKEYHDLMKNWIYNIAGNASYNESAISTGARVSNWFRQNVISTYIAFNPATILKHAPTAAVMSMKEVGLKPLASATFRVGADQFASAVSRMFGRDPALGDSLWKFIYDNSEEIQRRDRNWMDTMTGAHNIVYGRSSLRQKLMQWGAKGVALSDMVSAAPLWLAKYEEAMKESGAHGDAVNQANMAVRRAHGSTAQSSLPVIASEGGAIAPWFTSLYGFFGANMQRKIEIMHDMSDTYGLARDGQIKQAAKAIPGITTSVMAQVIWPALVEEAVVGQFTDDHRGFLAKSLTFTMQALANSIIGVRDFAWALGHGQEPSAGLISAPFHDIANVARDMKKSDPLSKGHAGKFVQDGLTMFGDLSGVSPKPIARALRYGIDVHNRVQIPRSVGDMYRGLASGVQRQRVER